MQDTLYVSQVESLDKLKANIAGLFKAGQYDEVSRAIGMYSILIDSEHTLDDQNRLYRIVLDMLKDKLHAEKGTAYGSWLTDFPATLAKLIESEMKGAGNSSADVIASHEAGFGPFYSLDDFYFWALDDRRLTLGQIIKYIERTA